FAQSLAHECDGFFLRGVEFGKALEKALIARCCTTRGGSSLDASAYAMHESTRGSLRCTNGCIRARQCIDMFEWRTTLDTLHVARGHEPWCACYEQDDAGE